MLRACCLRNPCPGFAPPLNTTRLAPQLLRASASTASSPANPLEVYPSPPAKTSTGYGTNVTDTVGATGAPGKRQRLVIIGTGWGGYTVLRTIDRSKYDVTVVSTRNHFLFTPLLPHTTVGTLEFRSIIQPVRTKENVNVDFDLSQVQEVDTVNKTLTCSSVVAHDHVYKVPYDKLVIACGARSNTFNLTGVRENSFFLKELSHARLIRQRILHNLELAAVYDNDRDKRRQLLHVVVVGGGATGVEFGASMYDFLQNDVDKVFSNIAKDVTVSLIEGNKVLGAFEARFQEVAKKKITSRSRMRIVESNVKEVTSEGVHLTDGRFLPSKCIVWVAGIQPQKLLTQLGDEFKRTRLGTLSTNNLLQVQGVNDVYAIGDCADVEGESLPYTAQVAETQGEWLSKHLAAVSDGDLTKAKKPYKFVNKGIAAYIGGDMSIVESPYFGWSGFTAFLGQSAIYATKNGATHLKFQTVWDRIRVWLWGRDVSIF